MVKTVMVVVLALAGCKKYADGAQIGERCQVDKDCAEGLDCHTWEHGGRICLKPCGPTAANPEEVVDRSCPSGWVCSQTEMRLVDKSGVDQGAAYLGLQDQPMCIRAR
jgi:hypothetical protein